ncbi:MAG: hypothetical protein C4519_07850 [Desulfobacteraceae bacterium]|nr:MAG: hypothetical protein C4519_07850 [Desulfobacteraceae bacterium]
MKTTLIVALSVFILVPSMALAQEWGPEAGDWEFTIQGSGTSDDDLDNNFAGLDASLSYYLSNGFQLGLRQGASWVDPGPGSDRWNGSSRLFMDYNFNLGRLRPFLGISAGYLYGEDTDERWIAGPEAGLKLFVQRKAFLFALGEYNFTFEDSDEIDEVYEDGRFVYALGIGLDF